MNSSSSDQSQQQQTQQTQQTQHHHNYHQNRQFQSHHPYQPSNTSFNQKENFIFSSKKRKRNSTPRKEKSSSSHGSDHFHNEDYFNKKKLKVRNTNKKKKKKNKKKTKNSSKNNDTELIQSSKAPNVISQLITLLQDSSNCPHNTQFILQSTSNSTTNISQNLSSSLICPRHHHSYFLNSLNQSISSFSIYLFSDFLYQIYITFFLSSTSLLQQIEIIHTLYLLDKSRNDSVLAQTKPNTYYSSNSVFEFNPSSLISTENPLSRDLIASFFSLSLSLCSFSFNTSSLIELFIKVDQPIFESQVKLNSSKNPNFFESFYVWLQKQSNEKGEKNNEEKIIQKERYKLIDKLIFRIVEDHCVLKISSRSIQTINYQTQENKKKKYLKQYSNISNDDDDDYGDENNNNEDNNKDDNDIIEERGVELISKYSIGLCSLIIERVILLLFKRSNIYHQTNEENEIFKSIIECPYDIDQELISIICSWISNNPITLFSNLKTFYLILCLDLLPLCIYQTRFNNSSLHLLICEMISSLKYDQSSFILQLKFFSSLLDVGLSSSTDLLEEFVELNFYNSIISKGQENKGNEKRKIEISKMGLFFDRFLHIIQVLFQRSLLIQTNPDLPIKEELTQILRRIPSSRALDIFLTIISCL